MIIRIFKIFIILFFSNNQLWANNQYFEEGLNLFKNKNEYSNEAKIKEN